MFYSPLMNDLVEKWKRVPGWTGYKISSFGNVKFRRFEEWQPCKQFLRSTGIGYKFIILRRGNGVYKRESVHRLVLLAFVGPSALVVNHLDGNRHNNRLENLQYVTVQENNIHAIEVLGMEYTRGSKNTEARMTEDGVLEARKRRAEGAPYRELAEKLGVSIGTIRKACLGQSWKHVLGPLAPVGRGYPVIS